MKKKTADFLHHAFLSKSPAVKLKEFVKLYDARFTNRSTEKIRNDVLTSMLFELRGRKGNIANTRKRADTL
jgi:hypothetical protein